MVATDRMSAGGVTFSSPMVNFPCVSLFSLAKACSFLTASLCRTEIQNFTLDFVYSWPGCVWVGEWDRRVSVYLVWFWGSWQRSLLFPK